MQKQKTSSNRKQRLQQSLLLVLASMLIMSCSSPQIQDYAGETPTLDVRDFFEGEITAWGVVQNRQGGVINRFRADMIGTWEGDRGVLDEVFVYSNGDVQNRKWIFTRESETTYSGIAEDVVGEARIEQSGNAINLNYVLQVPVGDRTYDLTFDDWMWLVEGDTIINRAIMRKFGFRVGELIVVIQKNS